VSDGRGARSRTPRRSQALTDFAPERDPLTVLEEQARSRVPELVPLRHARMALSPFAFFRGAAAIMAGDLARTPDSGIRVQLCGDAHLSNFGMYASPERQLVFDINDFDETLPGPWEWDVKRLATSLEVAARDNGFESDECRRIVVAAVAGYRRAMQEFASWSNLRVWYAYLPVDSLRDQARKDIDRPSAKLARLTVTKAKTRDHLQAFAKLVRTDGGTLTFINDPPVLVPVENLIESAGIDQILSRVRGAVSGYRDSLSADRRILFDQFRLVHIARKVVGVGSVGTRCWVALMLGRDADDPLILQMKEAQQSVLEPHLGASEYDNSGHRVVAGQRMMQASSDILLGWQRYSGFDEIPRDFYIRQLHDWKGSVEIEQMTPTGLRAYAALCAWTLARAHARTGDRVAIAAYLGQKPVFDEAIGDFAAAYADQNARDHAALLAGIAAGRIATS
jgi:uncharacterized protein (DUF2252 family)